VGICKPEVSLKITEAVTKERRTQVKLNTKRARKKRNSE
jgi:hypothetical protein